MPSNNQINNNNMVLQNFTGINSNFMKNFDKRFKQYSDSPNKPF